MKVTTFLMVINLVACIVNVSISILTVHSYRRAQRTLRHAEELRAAVSRMLHPLT